MTRVSALLGIDLGTSSVKAVLLDLEGSMLAAVSSAYPVRNPRPGWAETDPSDWWRSIVRAVREAVAAADAEPVAVGLSGQMHGLVPTDGAGVPVRPAMLWSDARAVAELAAYRDLPAGARARLANPLTPGMAGPLLRWLARNEPTSYETTRWALQPKDWIRARLTGEFHAEPSDASATLLYDVPADTWDVEVVAALGLDPARLPPLVASSGELAGKLLPSAAEELGVPAGIPVAAGAGDTAAAALGSGLVRPGEVQLTIGTGAQIVTPVAEVSAVSAAEIDAEPVTHLYRAATDQGWYSMAAVLNAGLVLDWVRGVLGGTWPELYAAAATPGQPDDPMFLPHLNGERTPYLDPGMRGGWVGLSPRHDRSSLLRAALEGVALAIRQALDALPAVSPAGTEPDLRLAGGGSTDPAWRQMLADVLNSRLRPVDVAAASGRGAALLGARAAGLLDEPAALALVPAAGEPAAAPSSAAPAHYSERYALFQRRVRALRQSEEKQ